MRTIPVETVERVWDQLEQVSREEASQLANRMREQQPALMVYLLAGEEALDTGEESGWLIYLGAVIFEIIASQQVDLRPVSPEEVMAAEEANVLLLEDLEEGSEMGFTDAVKSLLVTYNQMPLLSALLEALMSPHEDNPELAPDHIGMALIHLKTVIDCLDQ